MVVLWLGSDLKVIGTLKNWFREEELRFEIQRKRTPLLGRGCTSAELLKQAAPE